LDKIIPFVDSKHDRTKTNALIFLHPTGKIDTKKELETMLKSKRENRQLSAIYAITDLFETQFIPLLEQPMDSPNPKVSKKAIDVLQMFVLEEEPQAIKIASEWGILDELQSSQETESEESSSEEKNPEDMESLLSDINEPSEKKEAEPAKEAQVEKEAAAEEAAEDEAPETGINKIKNFMNNLFKK
jgi:hypothetical protein